MTRDAYAARTLTDEVRALKPRAKVERHGDPDGLGVHRTYSVSKSGAKWLARLLDVIEDRRIKFYEFDDNGRLLVTFVHTIQGDAVDAYDLAGVARVLDGD